MTMIEIIARAICGETVDGPRDEKFAAFVDSRWHVHAGQARAVLKALGEAAIKSSEV